jgi:hypothetical protein
MASRASIDFGLNRWHLRCLRGVFSTLIALAVVLTLFNGGCCYCSDGDDAALPVSVAQTDCDAPGKTGPGPLSIAPHCCHCLAHATIVAPQVNAVSIEYTAYPYRSAAAPFPEAADLTSPFEPPRA